MASIDEIWLVDFGEPHPGEPALRRPALIIGPPATFGTGFPFVIVLPMTTTERGLSLHIEIEPDADTGLDDVSYVQCEQIRSVNARRLVHHLGAIDARTSHRVQTVVRTLLDH